MAQIPIHSFFSSQSTATQHTHHHGLVMKFESIRHLNSSIAYGLEARTVKSTVDDERLLPLRGAAARVALCADVQ